MHIRRMNSDDIKVCDSANVKLKIVGNTQVVQFIVGNNKLRQVRYLSKDI